MTDYTPIEVATALSLYAYNRSPAERAWKLYRFSDGNCADLEDLVATLTRNSAYAATEFAYPTAVRYVQDALDVYGAEARRRCRIESECLVERMNAE